jgi:hypothetical protein
MVQYHTHTLPTATKAEAEAGLRDDIALSPASLAGAVLPTAPGQTGLTISDTPPLDPVDGQQWWNSSNCCLNVFFEDIDSGQWVQTAPGGGGGSGDLSGTTIDTGEQFRLIMLSTGAVYAIPYAAVPPAVPTGLVATVRLTSVNLDWTAVSGATSYLIKRNGVQIGTTGNRSYRDTAIVVGNTYSYTVSSADQYQQRSPASAPVSAFIDASLNTAPTDVTVTCWPNPIPTDGPAIIRVNARDLDVQTIAFTLGVDAGSLSATADPSVWVFRI